MNAILARCRNNSGGAIDAVDIASYRPRNQVNRLDSGMFDGSNGLDFVGWPCPPLPQPFGTLVSGEPVSLQMIYKWLFTIEEQAQTISLAGIRLGDANLFEAEVYADFRI